MRSLVAAISLLCAGCVTEPPAPEPDRVSIIATGDAAAATRAVETFGWAPGATVVGDLNGLDPAALDDMVRSEIRRVIEARGYRIAVEADRQIAFAIGVTDAADDAELARIFGMSPGLVGDAGQYGTLLIAILDPRTGSPLYRAGAQVMARPELSEAQRRERISRAVESLLAPLGPRS